MSFTQSKMKMIHTLSLTAMMMAFILITSATIADGADTTAAAPITTTTEITTTASPADAALTWGDKQRQNFSGPWAFFWLVGVFTYGLILSCTCRLSRNRKKELTRQAAKFKQPKEPIV